MALATADGLAFTYPGGGEPALRDVSFSIRPGQKIAVVRVIELPEIGVAIGVRAVGTAEVAGIDD